MRSPIVGAGEVSLRPWRTEEAALYVRSRDPEIFRFTTESPDLDEATARRNIVDAASNPNLAPFAICDSEDRPVGNMAVMRRPAAVEISYWLNPAARGKGWATAALGAATEWVRKQWPGERIVLEIDPANAASIRLAKRLGYRRAGIRLESACGGPALLYEWSAEIS